MLAADWPPPESSGVSRSRNQNKERQPSSALTSKHSPLRLRISQPASQPASQMAPRTSWRQRSAARGKDRRAEIVVGGTSRQINRLPLLLIHRAANDQSAIGAHADESARQCDICQSKAGSALNERRRSSGCIFHFRTNGSLFGEPLRLKAGPQCGSARLGSAQVVRRRRLLLLVVLLLLEAAGWHRE